MTKPSPTEIMTREIVERNAEANTLDGLMEIVSSVFDKLDLLTSKIERIEKRVLDMELPDAPVGVAQLDREIGNVSNAMNRRLNEFHVEHDKLKKELDELDKQKMDTPRLVRALIGKGR